MKSKRGKDIKKEIGQEMEKALAKEKIEVKNPKPKTEDDEEKFHFMPCLPHFLMNIGQGVFKPKFEMMEDKNKICLNAELPGMTEKDITVSLEGPLLTIRGMKKSERVSRDESCHFSEFSYGSFSRSFALPDTFDPKKVHAEFAKGVLKLTIPKNAKKNHDDGKIVIKAER